MRCFYILPCSCDIFKSQTRIPVHTSSISVYSFAYIKKIFLTDKFTYRFSSKNRTAFPSPSQRVLKSLSYLFLFFIFHQLFIILCFHAIFLHPPPERRRTDPQLFCRKVPVSVALSRISDSSILSGCRLFQLYLTIYLFCLVHSPEKLTVKFFRPIRSKVKSLQYIHADRLRTLRMCCNVFL